jgi:hypothetical protein
MPTKKTPRSRPWRSVGFSSEVLRLFRELEAVRPSRRFNDPRTLQLAKLLNLTDEYWTVNYVNDTDGICHPPGYIANIHWETCRRIREELLEAVKKNPAK